MKHVGQVLSACAVPRASDGIMTRDDGCCRPLKAVTEALALGALRFWACLVGAPPYPKIDDFSSSIPCHIF